MGFQSMRRNTCIISPNLMQKRVALYDTLGGAEQKLENVGFFFSEANFTTIFGQQYFGRWLERLVPKRENSILGLLMLPQLGADTGQEDRKFEGLTNIIIGSCLKPQNCVGIGNVTSKHQNWTFDALFADYTAQVAAISIWQTHIQDNNIIKLLPHPFKGISAATTFGHFEFFRRDQLFTQRLAQVFIIIDQKDFFQLRHCDNPFLWVFNMCALVRCIARFVILASQACVENAGIVSIPLQKGLTETS